MRTQELAQQFGHTIHFRDCVRLEHDLRMIHLNCWFEAETAHSTGMSTLIMTKYIFWEVC